MTGPTLGIIPARGGSKGIPGKNIRLLAGRPLLQYTVDAARASGVIDRLVISTDSDEIADAARALGVEVPFMRPKELAQDDTPMLAVLEHAVATLEAGGCVPEIVVLLQPTSPLRRPQHLADAVALLRATRADSVVSVVELPRHLSPDCVMRIDEGRLRPFLGTLVTRRQAARPAFVRDGTVYTFWRDTLVEQHSIYGADCRPLLVRPEDSITVDEPEDWAAAERALAARGVAHRS